MAEGKKQQAVKASGTKTARGQTVAAASASTRKSRGSAQPPVSAEDRNRMVAEAAYYRAEKRGFVGGDPLQDWAEAEQEVDAALQEKSGKRARTKAAE